MQTHAYSTRMHVGINTLCVYVHAYKHMCIEYACVCMYTLYMYVCRHVGIHLLACTYMHVNTCMCV